MKRLLVFEAQALDTELFGQMRQFDQRRGSVAGPGYDRLVCHLPAVVINHDLLIGAIGGIAVALPVEMQAQSRLGYWVVHGAELIDPCGPQQVEEL